MKKTVVIVLLALLAFEVFNFSYTHTALNDILGPNLRFGGISWVLILTIAFCAIDFSGVATLFTPKNGRDKPTQSWYLYGAWLLAAALNANLTWWGATVSMRSNPDLAAKLAILGWVPVTVAIVAFLVRSIIVGYLTLIYDPK